MSDTRESSFKRVSIIVLVNVDENCRSILKDKLPEELDKNEYVILKLSQNDKLFRIEKKFF